MWAPFHKNNFYGKKNLREASMKATAAAAERRDLDYLFDELDDDDSDQLPYSDFFLPEPKTERLGYENIIIDELEIGHSSIQGKDTTIDP